MMGDDENLKATYIKDTVRHITILRFVFWDHNKPEGLKYGWNMCDEDKMTILQEYKYLLKEKFYSVKLCTDNYVDCSHFQ